MTRRRAFLVLAGTAVAVSLAFLLRDSMNELIIVPLAYLWWLIVLYYHTVPQTVVWLILIFAIFITAGRGFLLAIPVGRKVALGGKKPPGPIEDLAALMEKGNRGIYYKWLIANRLGKVARELLDQRDGQLSARRFARLTGRDWDPSRGVEAYLESGLNGSFADFPQSRWSNPLPTPLDEDPVHVIEYLESEMEIGRNGDR